MEPIGGRVPDDAFVHDTKAAADLLGISPKEVMELARSGKLLFKYVRAAGRYRTRQADVDRYIAERERRQGWEL